MRNYPMPGHLKSGKSTDCKRYRPAAAKSSKTPGAASNRPVESKAPARWVGDSAFSKEFRRYLRAAARGSFPLMILGEPGVGKEHAARLIHGSSRYRRGLPVVVSPLANSMQGLVERGVETAPLLAQGTISRWLRKPLQTTYIFRHLQGFSLAVQRLISAMIGGAESDGARVIMLCDDLRPPSPTVLGELFVKSVPLYIPHLGTRPEDLLPLARAMAGPDVSGLRLREIAESRRPWFGNADELARFLTGG
jgi:hypothetical protein